MSAALVPVLAVVLLDALGYTLIVPLLPMYAERFGASPFAASALFAAYPVFQMIAAVGLGRLSDRIGRRPVLVGSQLGTLASFVLLAKANSLWVLFLARALDGATAGNTTVALAQVSDVTPPAERTRAFALIGACFSIGFFAGPSLIAVLAGRGMHTAIWVAAGFSAASVILSAVLIKDARPPGVRAAAAAGRQRRGLGAMLQRRGLSALFAIHFAYALSLSVFASGFALFAERALRWSDHPYGLREIGIVCAYAALVAGVLQVFVTKRVTRAFGDQRVVLLGMLALAIDFALFSTSPGIGLVCLCTTLGGFGQAFTKPAVSALVSRRVDPTEQGAAMGALTSLTSASLISGPILGGALLQRGWLAAWALTCALSAALGAVVALRLPTDERSALP